MKVSYTYGKEGGRGGERERRENRERRNSDKKTLPFTLIGLEDFERIFWTSCHHPDTLHFWGHREERERWREKIVKYMFKRLLPGR